MVVVKGDAYYEVLCQFVDISFMLAVLVELGIPHDFKQFKKNNTLFFWCLFFFLFEAMATGNLCRLCALDCNTFMKVFGQEGEKTNIVDKIKQCLQIWVYPEDQLPKIICLHCCEKVESFFSFFNSCHQSQSSLMDICKKKDQNTSDAFNVFQLQEKEGQIYSLNEFDAKSALEYNIDCLLLEDKVSRKKPCDSSDRPEANVNESISNEKLVEERFKPSADSKSDSQEDERSDREDDIFDIDNSSQQLNSKKLFEGYVWKCSSCEKECTSLPQLKLHYQEIHNEPPSFKCMQCSKVYTHYRSFARHVKLHGDCKKYSCEICGKSFAQKTVLQSHSTVHSEERPHVCAQCGKAFKQFSSLYLHSKCHLPEQAKPKYPCTVCLKVFSSKHTVETHMKIHTGEKNFICDICGKRFISKGSLDYHILAHNDAKPHSCQVCGKCFKTARLLAKHSTVHTGVKPHQCDVCGKQFRERGALKEHNRIHTGAMPYSCEYCGKNFRFKGILTVHIRQHTGERPYSCGECRREFTNWANYNKHMKRRHKEVTMGNTLERDADAILSEVEIPAPPAYIEPTPPPPYKLPLPSEEDVFRIQQHSYPSPPLPMAYYIHPLHSLLQRAE